MVLFYGMLTTRKLALALDVSADELVFDKAERQPQMVDKELLENREKIDDPPRRSSQTGRRPKNCRALR